MLAQMVCEDTSRPGYDFYVISFFEQILRNITKVKLRPTKFITASNDKAYAYLHIQCRLYQ